MGNAGMFSAYMKPVTLKMWPSSHEWLKTAISTHSSPEETVGDGHLSAHLDPLHQSCQPLAGRNRSEWGGKLRQVCTRLETPCTMGQKDLKRIMVCKPGCWCSGPSVMVRLQLGRKARSWLQQLRGCKSCSELLTGGLPIPSQILPPEQPWEAPSSRHRCVRLFK